MGVHKKRIIIIDDHPLFREGIKTILSRKPKYEVVGETGTGRQGLQIVKDLKPDLVLLDLSLPDIRGLELIGDIGHKKRQVVISAQPPVDISVSGKKSFNAMRDAEGGIDQLNTSSDFSLNDFFQKGIMGTTQYESVDLAEMNRALVGVDS